MENTRTEQKLRLDDPATGSTLNPDSMEQVIQVMKEGWQKVAYGNKLVPRWNPERGTSIRAHLTEFETMGKLANWGHDEAAINLIQSITGQAKSIIDLLTEKQKADYSFIKQKLMEIYGQRNPRANVVQQIKNLKWRSNDQSLREFIMITAGLMANINAEGGSPEEKFNVRDRVLKAIQETEPRFGRLMLLHLRPGEKFKRWTEQLCDSFDNYREWERLRREDAANELLMNKQTTVYGTPREIESEDNQTSDDSENFVQCGICFEWGHRAIHCPKQEHYF